MPCTQLAKGGCDGLLDGQQAGAFGSDSYLQVADPRRLRRHLDAGLATSDAREAFMEALSEALADVAVLRRALLPMEVTEEVRNNVNMFGQVATPETQYYSACPQRALYVLLAIPF